MFSFWKKNRHLLRPVFPLMGLALFCMLLVDILGYIFPMGITYVTDEVYPLVQESQGMALLIRVCLMLIGVSLFRGCMVYVMIRCFWSSAERIVRDLRRELYEKLQHLDLAFYDRSRIGDLMSRLTSDLQLIKNFFAFGLEHRFRIFLITLTILTIMIIQEWRLALLVYAVIPVLILIILHFSERMRKAVQAKQRQVGVLSSRVQENLAGIRIVKAYAKEQSEIESFMKENHRLKNEEVRVSLLQLYLAPILQAVDGLGALIIVGYGGWQVIRGEMSLGILLGFISYLGIMRFPLNMLSMNTSLYNQARGAVERVGEILDQPDQKRYDRGTRTDLFQGRLELKGLTFQYEEGTPILENLNCLIEPGEKVALFGLTGSGKSTLVSLIPRFYPPTSGKILMDGVDIREWNLQALRAQIGIVLQETFLFSTSIRENIAFGRPEAPFEEVIEAAKSAQIHDYILSLPEGYDTQIGEYGVGLSGGQRQRVAIARTLLQDPRLLILDDCTSSLDTITEGKIQAQLNRLMEGRTTIIISQKIAAFARVDRIVVLNRGTIEDMGSHDRLMRNNRLYRDTYRTQLVESPMEGAF